MTSQVSTIEEVCSDCNGTGVKPTENGAMNCPCQKIGRGPRYLESAEIPPRFTDCTFENYRPLDESQTRARLYTSALAGQFPVNRGLLMIGPPGTGKTHLAVATLKSIVLKDHQGMFIEFGSLLRRIQECWDKESSTTEWSLLARVNYSPVLVLDELGARRPTDWASDTLYEIVNGRYNRKLLTIMTSNYLDEPKPGDESLEDRIGARLRSRLFEMCKTIQIEGPDYRRLKDQKDERVI